MDATVRSPSYPSMSLGDAVRAVGKIEGSYRTAPVDRENAAKLIGYRGLSGPANKTLAALASYGLVERAGKGLMRVTSRARAILHASDESERQKNLHEAALEPRLFQEIQDHFEGIVPPEDGVINFLNRQGFNQNAVKPAARAFLQTWEFLKESGASESHGSEQPERSESPLSNGDEVTKLGGAKVGDLVQWESQGALQFPTPRRVRLVSEDGNWVAVEGSETGLPMDEIIVEAAADNPRSEAPTFPLAPDQQEAEWMRSRVGSDTKVRLLVEGDMGPKEIGKLIKLLEAQKLVLEDE